MSILQLIVNESTRKLSNRSSNQVFVVNDANVDTIRFSIPAGFSDITIDDHTSFRVMYIPPGIDKTVYAKTLTFVQNDGVYISYDWQVGPNILTSSGILTVSFCILKTGSEVQEWHTIPCTISVSNTIHTDDSDEADETITPTVAQRVAVLETMIQRVASGAPIVVASASAMTDTEQIYVLSTDGNWYYHNGSAWTVGGEYGAVSTDTTLTQSGIPADAKTVGDEVAIIKSDVDAISAYNTTEIEFAPNLSIGRYIRLSDGTSQSGGKYARTSSLWNGSGYCTAIALEDNVYEFCLAFYGTNGDLVNGTDYIKSSGYVQGGTIVNIIPDAVKFGISFRRYDQAGLTDSDSTAISAALKCYNSTAEIAKSAAQSALASCESIVVSKDIDKDAGTVKNYYIRYTQGKVYSSSKTVKTLCFECAPNSIYKISHPKSTQFVVASYSSEPVLNSIANKVYNGREENETTFVTDANATWIGIYYYSSANNPDITPEETYDALSISTVGLDTIAETIADLAQAQPSSIAYGFYSSDEVIEIPTTFEGVIELYDGLVAEHPDYVTKNVLISGDVTNYEYVFTHGDYNRDSSAKRNPDPMIAKPVIILSSGVHGYERSAVMSLYKLMSDICNCNYALADLIEYVTIKVIPVGCPWSYTNNSRLNANGVNINRNFATSTWGDYDPGTPGSPDYAGPSAGSEDETKILQAWMVENSDALFYVDFHNSNFSSEVAMLAGSDEADSTAFKKRYLLGMNKIIPYWQRSRGMASSNNYYCYTGGYETIEGRVSRNYAYEAGIHLSFSHETSWNINGTGKHSQTTLNVGAEAMGNFLLGMTDYYKEI